MSGAVPTGSDGARCTVIIPARNAADTIEETIASVWAQTCADWQAIVVDDGSTDGTAAIVERLAAIDPRVRLVSGPGRGPGAARNAGVRAAATPFISFLDADDLLASTFLERMLERFEPAPELAAAYTDWLRLAPDGTTEQGPCPHLDGDLFDLFAATCVFPPHACVIRRANVDEAGGFDEAPTTTEDWDLWQRIARTGARFAHVKGPLVVYRMRSGSRSRNSRRVLNDGLAVIATGHAPDPRVRRPHPAHEVGRAPSLLARASYNHLSWAAGMALASGEDPVPLLAALADLNAPDLDPLEVGGTMLEAMRVTSCVPPSASLSVVAERAGGLLEFLRALERASAAPDLALRVALAVDRLISQQDVSARPRTLLVTHEAAIELAQPLAEVTDLPVRVDRFSAALTYAGAPLGEIELPVRDRRVASWLIADAAASAAGWPLLELFLSHCVYPASQKNAVAFDASSWAVFVQELFGMRGETLSRIYESAPDGDGTAPAADSVLEIDVSDPLRDLRVDAESALVRFTIGGAPFAEVVVPTVDGVLTPGSVRRAFTDTRPDELVRVVVREGIIGWPVGDEAPLSRRLANRRATAVSLRRRSLR